MPSDIPSSLRRLVFERATGRCEYCLLSQEVTVHQHEPDHLLPKQHGGNTTADNLALACTRCNRNKGPNLGSIDIETGKLTSFFNPRKQHWEDHFRLDGPIIRPLTPEARVTIKILRINDPKRVEERRRLMGLGLYP